MKTLDITLLAGPTASGKSALALMLAENHNGVVINADSMQVYTDLQVLSARPSEVEMQGCPHFLYGHVDGGDQYSAARWLADLSETLDKLDGQYAVLVGGTGLYFSSLGGMMAQMPQVPEAIRTQVRARIENEGTEALHAWLEARDPQAAHRLQPTDSQRIARAVEMIEATGEKFSSLQDQAPLPSPMAGLCVERIILEPERADLHKRIESRFGQMVEKGGLDEVEALMARELREDRTVLKAIGVPQLAAFLRGEISKDEAVEKSVIATRQYAKRQSTWFRNQMDESWRRIVSADEY